jgi:hypothetical protein
VLTPGGSSTVKYSTVQYSTIQHSSSQHSTIQYSTVEYITVQHSTLLYTKIQYSILQYSTLQHITVQYSTVQYSKVHYRTVHIYTHTHTHSIQNTQKGTYIMIKRKNLEVQAVPVLASYTLSFALQLRKKHRNPWVRVVEKCSDIGDYSHQFTIHTKYSTRNLITPPSQSSSDLL